MAHKDGPIKNNKKLAPSYLDQTYNIVNYMALINAQVASRPQWSSGLSRQHNLDRGLGLRFESRKSQVFSSFNFHTSTDEKRHTRTM